MRTSLLAHRAWASLLLSVLVSSCAVGRSVVGGATDAASADASDATSLDVPAMDVVDDTPDVPDAPDAPDAPDVPLACASDGDCATSALGPVCDTATGRCVRCTTARDTCPAAQHCDLGACVDGCRDDDGCALAVDAGVDAGAAGRVCDTANHRCVACVRDDQCPVGNLCMSQRCVAGCSETRGCAAGLTCCGGGCVDVQTSADTCGACGTRCAVDHGAAGCAGGRCTVATCADGYADCDDDPANGCETDTRTSAVSCGACRRACVFPHAAAACVAGACAMGACDTGFVDCDGAAANGCEVDTRTSLAHCGGCGRACTFAHAAAVCAAGACAIGTCDAGFADCNGDARDGCESPLTTTTNCGACGRACAFTNASSSCASGACSLVACSTGFGDCDGSLANGCEAALGSDPAHCGTCATTCTFAHAASLCTAGACAPGTCDAGFGNCDGTASNGCETATTTSTAHCGGCGRACLAGQSCRAGVCFTDCASGLTACGAACFDLATDAAHCGRCDVACGASQRCVAGACVATVTCATGFTLCGAGCFDTRVDGANCGGCGVACTASQRCVAGACVTQRTGCAVGVDLESRGVCLSAASVVPRVCAASDLTATLPARRALFDGVGADQSWVVPAGVTEVVVKLWGAGGGNTMYATAGGAGGAGAFVRARLTVTPGETLTVIVGQGGPNDAFSRATVYGGGGLGGYFGTGGGGRAALRRGSTELVTAAGGGGGSTCSSSTPCGDGGAGGVARGENGLPSTPTDGTYGLPGEGASITCGGNGGFQLGCGCGLSAGDGGGGVAFVGGTTIGAAPGQGGGGGGGGWLGGGAGAGDCAGFTGGGGGGGSSYVLPTDGCGVAGVGVTPGNNTDADRTGTVAQGAAARSGSAGGAGRVVIYY